MYDVPLGRRMLIDTTLLARLIDVDAPGVEPGQLEESFLLFSVSGVGLAVPALHVASVSSVDEATPVPGAPSHILGLVVTGERVLPLLDLAAFLELSASPVKGDPAFRRTLFVAANDLEAGLVCSRAHGLVSVPTSSLHTPSVLQGTALRRFLASEVDLGTGVVGVLDLQSLLASASVA
jgi:purine-binding chemotaxis protein CheW